MGLVPYEMKLKPLRLKVNPQSREAPRTIS